MKVKIKAVSGEDGGDIQLPKQFDEPVRPDLIKRAVLAQMSHSFQPQGTDPEAGKKYESKLSRRRRDYKGAYGIGISRVPRKIMSYRGTRFNWVAATAPNTVGGRDAHPPQAEKVIAKKINMKERRKAIRSALAASVVKELVKARGHVVEGDYPVVLEDASEKLDKTQAVIELLSKLGFEKELERCSQKSEKTGKARLRGRAFKTRKGPLFVVSDKCSLEKSAINIPGVDVVKVKDLNAEALAPGTHCGRLTLFTKHALETMSKEGLFAEK